MKRKRKPKLRPVIKITSDHLMIFSVIADLGILVLLILWFLLEVFKVI